MRSRTLATAAIGGLGLSLAVAVPAAGAGGHARTPHQKPPATTSGGSNSFSVGQLQAQTVGAPGCGTHDAG